MQHDVHIGAAIADINDPVRANLQFVLQAIKDGDLSVAGGDLVDGFDFT